MQLGKVIGGGLPVGAYGGRKDIMQMVAPAGRTHFPSEFMQCVARMASMKAKNASTFTRTSLMYTAWGSKLCCRLQGNPALGELFAGMMQCAEMGSMHGPGLGSGKAECELAAPACRPHAAMGSMHGPG